MPYFSPSQLDEALAQLAESHPIVIALLAMLKKQLPQTDDQSKTVKYGAADENALLEHYFSPLGAPPDKPFYVPFGEEKRTANRLRDRKYAGRTLQKLRTKDWGKFFLHTGKDGFAFRPDVANLIKAEPRLLKEKKVPLTALTVWLKRESPVDSVQTAVDQVAKEFNLNLYGFDTIFVADDLPRYSDKDLRAETMTEQDIAEIIGLAPAPTKPTFSQSELEEKIATRLSKKHTRVDNSLLSSMLSAWFAHDIVVLVGAPGTGKTRIAKHFLEAFSGEFDSGFVETDEVVVDPDFDLARFIGYANLDGKLVPSTFTQKFLLDETRAYFSCLLLLDEWNLATIDEYMAPVLAAIESDTPIPLPGSTDSESTADTGRHLPSDMFIIATCNSYLEEPETRRPISRPVKRRCTIFQVPNWLAIDAAKHGVAKALSDIADLLLAQEISTLKIRMDRGRATAVDFLRMDTIGKFEKYQDLPQNVRTLLEQLITALLAHESARRFLTIGILKDVLFNTLYSTAGNEELAIAQQLAGKLIHLLQGSIEDLKDLPKLFSSPDAKAITEGALQDYAYAAKLGGTDFVSLV